jgi:hypothetical protein
MKKEPALVRTIMVVVRLNQEEYNKLKRNQARTTERSISNYLRKLAIQKPVTVKYRNATADDFLRDMVELKKELNGIGNNYNQAVKKLHTLDRIAEFRNWMHINEPIQNGFLKKVNEILLKVNELHELWLQK